MSEFDSPRDETPAETIEAVGLAFMTALEEGPQIVEQVFIEWHHEDSHRDMLEDICARLCQRAQQALVEAHVAHMAHEAATRGEANSLTDSAGGIVDAVAQVARNTLWGSPKLIPWNELPDEDKEPWRTVGRAAVRAAPQRDEALEEAAKHVEAFAAMYKAEPPPDACDAVVSGSCQSIAYGIRALKDKQP